MSAENNFTTLEEAEFLVRRAQARAEFEALSDKEKAERFAQTFPDLWVVRELVSDEWSREDLHPLFLIASEDYRHKRGRLGGYLFILRRRYNMTLAEAAEKAGVAELSWVLWEMELKPIPKETIIELTARLRLTQVEERSLRRLHKQLPLCELRGIDHGLEDFLSNTLYSLKNALRDLRERLGWSFETTDQEAFLKPGTWRKWERGRLVPSADELWQALNHLDWVNDWEVMSNGVPQFEFQESSLWFSLYVERLTRGERFEASFPLGPIGLEKARNGELPVRNPSLLTGEHYNCRHLSLAHFLKYERESRDMDVETACDWAEVDVQIWEAWESGELLPDPWEIECLSFLLFESRARQEELVTAWESSLADWAA